MVVMVAGSCAMLLPPRGMKIASISPRSNPFFVFFLFHKHPILPSRIKSRNSRVLFSQDNGLEEGEPQNGKNGSNRQKDSSGSNQRPIFPFRWGDFLNPDPQNILAVGLTGLLTWASVQVLWQLVFISVAILVAALKYSLVAAILLFIVIALL